MCAFHPYFVLLFFRCHSFKLNETVTVNVSASNEFTTLYAVVLGRPGIIYSKIYSSSERSFQTFKLELSSEMVPEATLFVYYYQSTGEIIYDRLVLPFEKQLPNQVTGGLDGLADLTHFLVLID